MAAMLQGAQPKIMGIVSTAETATEFSNKKIAYGRDTPCHMQHKISNFKRQRNYDYMQFYHI